MSIFINRQSSFFIIFVTVALTTFSALANNKQDQKVQDQQEVLTPLEKRLQRNVTVNFNEVAIGDAIRMMTERAELDVVKSPKVEGTVTTRLTDVPVGEALSNILAAHGYGYVIDKNMIRIAPAEDLAVESEKLVSRIYRITYADVTQVQEALKKFISPKGSLSANVGTSNIIITDTESKINAIDTFIDEVDRITPQILVEARIYDVTSKDRLDLGVNWQIGTNTTFDPDTGRPTTVGAASQGGVSETNPFTRGMFSSNVDEATGSNNTIRFGVLNSSLNIDAILRAEKEELCATLLANPRILVLDNEKALFKSVSEIPYQELQETTGGGQIGTTAFKEVGVTLSVIPHVARDDMIRLRVIPEFSISTGNVLVSGFNVNSPQPVIDKRNADTTLLVKDGQTIVLGGLRRRETNQQKNEVPLLCDLPLLGPLFRFQGEETVNSELVVFITPKVVIKPELSPEELERLRATNLEACPPNCPVPKLSPCQGKPRVEQEVSSNDKAHASTH